jgi:hypothetical protein
MKRRMPAPPDPPARLLTFSAEDWLPLVDPAGYDPDRHRNISNGVPYGEPHMTAEQWRLGEALSLWSRARQDWHREHGWPGHMEYFDLMRDSMRVRRDISIAQARPRTTS